MKLKKFIKFFIFLIIQNSLIHSLPAQTILIDPGHGGEEVGAVGVLKNKDGTSSKIYEKDLALEIAKNIYDHLKLKYSTYLTRSVDRYVTLDERAELAEKIKADIIISIHINSYKDHNTSGFETYYLDNHKNMAVNKVESIENKNLKGGELVINQILIDLVIEKTVKKSQTMAELVHSMLKDKIQKPFKIKDRKVRPGLFYILALSKRPGLLLEVGYITNQNDLEKLVNPDFQIKYAKTIAESLDKYFDKNKPIKNPML